MMTNIANLLGLVRDDAQRREDSRRSELQNTIQSTNQNLQKSIMEMGQQVQLLTNTVKTLNSQVSATGDYASDAIQQVREELSARIDALSKGQPASNAGGDGNPGSATDHPLDARNGEKSKGLKEAHFAITCSYCDGEVPKSIAKHCQFCDLYYHPGHLQRHRDEWPCPLVDYDLCPWCSEHMAARWNVKSAAIRYMQNVTTSINRARKAGIVRRNPAQKTYQKISTRPLSQSLLLHSASRPQTVKQRRLLFTTNTFQIWNN